MVRPLGVGVDRGVLPTLLDRQPMALGEDEIALVSRHAITAPSP
jgi:hypothetical protein